METELKPLIRKLSKKLAMSRERVLVLLCKGDADAREALQLAEIPPLLSAYACVEAIRLMYEIPEPV
ncbi:MAG: hypothetical protein A4S09_02180 [Proteobacteria bacterium SG_bin7]|nr:MAG: hypothetical protein A4S09_02180 [Proteobacteria bacterium SG_bin7]